MIRYADDFVLMGKTLKEEVLMKLKAILNRMGLSLNKRNARTIPQNNGTLQTSRSGCVIE